jgi:hypothetical protein
MVTITSSTNAKSCRKSCAGVACSVTVVGRLRSLHESGETIMLTDRVEKRSSPRQQFVNVGLVRDVEKDFVFRRVKDTVKSNRQFDDPQIRSQVSPIFGNCFNED